MITKFEWCDKRAVAFQEMKHKLTTTLVLALPAKAGVLTILVMPVGKG